VRTNGSTGAFVNEIALEEVTSMANNVVPIADFSAAPTTGTAPLTVQFRDLSRGLITGRSWDFGEGAAETRANPTYTYNQPGTYTVRLNVDGINGSDTEVRTKLIDVTSLDVDQTIMHFDPASIPGTIGTPTTVAVAIDNVTDLGAFQFTMNYEPDKAAIQSVELGEFPGSTGRTFTAIPAAIDSANGTVTFSAYSQGANVPGANGGGVLANIQLVPRSSPSLLSLSDVQVTDVAGGVIDTMTQDGSVNSNACPGDFDGDGDRDTLDVQRVAYRVDTQIGDDLYDSLYDGDDDGDIDIADVQRVAALWSTRCNDANDAIDVTGTLQDEADHDQHFSSSFTLNSAVPFSGNIAASGNARLSIDSPDSTITAGETYTVSVNIGNASNMAAFGFTAFYDPALAEITGITIGSFAESSERTFAALGPMTDEQAGRVTFGAYSLGATKSGLSGDGAVAILALRAKVDGGSSLRLMSGRTSDAVGNAQSVCLSSTCGWQTAGGEVFLPLIRR
jgi:PKD repeat protein